MNVNEQIPQEFHRCPPMSNVNGNELMRIIEVNFFNLETHTWDTVVMLAMFLVDAKQMMHIQVDYCPWCSAMLARKPMQAQMAEAKQNEAEKRGYIEYRRRHVQSGENSAPLSEELYAEYVADYAELVTLIAHARPEHKISLEQRYNALRKALHLEPKISEREAA